MHDANYLLDEALSHMTTLKAKQETKKRVQWNEMPEKQREELENSFRQTGRVARYTNIMGIKRYRKKRKNSSK
ncbi:unnamed protein product [Rotaria sp. Silwood2]|nr:unnamed protein product [Rotaria sp. Silwood2]CAF4690317.1 unnamed protein product [Rotaria sp. Silwood2]